MSEPIKRIFFVALLALLGLSYWLITQIRFHQTRKPPEMSPFSEPSASRVPEEILYEFFDPESVAKLLAEFRKLTTNQINSVLVINDSNVALNVDKSEFLFGAYKFQLTGTNWVFVGRRSIDL